ncbi:MAG TPA: hypothetical protein VMZ53_14775 [Kofleriaceae bacterium]|nr:hypothetical protein [Kofleriaceae bacterium]
MRAAVALLLTMTMTLAGCFPHDPHKRTIAKLAEGGALVGGIAISAFANTGADCDNNANMPGQDPSNCRSTAKWLSTLGVTLILAGLLGFVATVSTAEDEDKTTATTTTVPDGAGSGSGSATTTTTTTTTTPPPTQTTPPPTDTPPPPPAGTGEGSGSATPTPPTP